MNQQAAEENVVCCTLDTGCWNLNDFSQSRSRAELQSQTEDMSRLTHPMDTVRARALGQL